MVVLDTDAAANIARSRWLRNRNLFLGALGQPHVSTYLACARFKFDDRRLGEVSFAADTTVGATGCKAAFTAFALDADTPASLRKGASEALGG